MLGYVSSCGGSDNRGVDVAIVGVGVTDGDGGTVVVHVSLITVTPVRFRLRAVI